MIARTAHAAGFGRLAIYLESDKADPGVSRVAWSSRYNLPTDSLRSAARWMERTAERNRLVPKPAYHLFISAAPDDDASRPRMQRVAQRLLVRLGLEDHQAVAVGHDDCRHPHLHIAVNRVHPVSLHAWNATRDWPRIEHALRALERELGFRPTPGRLAPTPDGVWADNARAMPVGARRFELREKEKARAAEARGETYEPRPSFLRHVRERFGARAAGAVGWAQLEAEAAQLGLGLVQTGQGLLVTDGTHHAGISRVAPGTSLDRLTRTFGEDYEAFLGRTAAGRVLPPLRLAGGKPGISGGAAGGGAARGGSARASADGAAPIQDGRAGAAGPGPSYVGGGGLPRDPAAAGGDAGGLGRGRGRADAPVERGGVAAGVDRRGGEPDAPVDGGLRGRERRHAGGDGPGGAGGDRHGGPGADGRAGEGGERPGQAAGGEHARGGEPHHGGAARAGAVGGPAAQEHPPLRGAPGGRDGAAGPAPGPLAVAVLGDVARGHGSVEPGRAPAGDLPAGAAGAAAGDPPGAGVAEHAGARGAFRVERVPAGWAVVDPAGARRWTLAREDSARRYAARANAARTPAELHRTLAALRAETSPEWYQLVLRKRAADALLDSAAGHAFVDPLRATDAVRWAHLRHHPLGGFLAAGPSAFGTLRVQAEEPARWAALPEPRHDRVPAWVRFRETAETWVSVQEGQPWAVPSALPPPPPPPPPPSFPEHPVHVGRAAPLPADRDVPELGGFGVPRVQRGLDL